MPNINRIRVNNVKYNFGTQAYDDFIMKPFGKNTLYDLANGGGKSVLMLLMLQTVLPNCTLDDKQPVEKLFRTGDGSQTIHSLIEWNLDQKDMKQGFKYMLTGFCARKATGNLAELNPSKETASIEYFNYCIFYREYNENDIRNLPLVKNKERITYSGLRKYLKDLERDNSYIVKIFDRKGEYQTFISQYGLYESEWEIIRGINKTEGHVRTYFESNYKTTRKVVEDLLIEEIIEKSFRLKSGSGEATDMMSKTLLDIKDRLLELSKKKEEISSYDKQIEIINHFSKRVEGILKTYQELSHCEKNLVHMYVNLGQLHKKKIDAIELNKTEIESYKEKLFTLTKAIESAKYFIDKSAASDLWMKLNDMEEELSKAKASYHELQDQLNLKESVNDYLEYQEEKRKRDEISEAIAVIKNKSTGLIDEIHTLTYHLKERFSKKEGRLQEEIHKLRDEINISSQKVQDLDFKTRLIEKEIAISDSKMEHATEKSVELCKQIGKLKANLGLLITENVSDEIKSHEIKLEHCKDYRKILVTSLIEIEKEFSELEIGLTKSEYESSSIKSFIFEAEAFFNEYEDVKKRVEALSLVYGKHDYLELREEIKRKYKTNIGNLEDVKKRIITLETEIKRLRDKSFITNSKVLHEIKDDFKVNARIQLQTGEEYLQACSRDEKKSLLERYPYLPYSIVVKEGFDAIKSEIQTLYQLSHDIVLPIIDERALTFQKDIVQSEYVYLLAKDQSIFFDDKRLEQEINVREKELEEVKRLQVRFEEQEISYLTDEAQVQEFILKYVDKYHKLKDEVLSYNQSLAALEKKAMDIKRELHGRSEKKEKTRQLLQSTEEEMLQLESELERLKELLRLDTENKSHEAILTQEIKKKEHFEEQLESIKEEYRIASYHLESVQSRMDSKDASLKELSVLWDEKYQKYYVEGDYEEINLSDDELMAKLNGICLAFETEHTDLEDKNHLVNSYVNGMNRCLRSISNRGISTSLLAQLYDEGKLYKVGETEFATLSADTKSIKEKIETMHARLDEKKAEFNRLDGKSGQTLQSYQEKYGELADVISDKIDAKVLIERNKEQVLKLKEDLKVMEQDQLIFLEQSDYLLNLKKDMERIFKNRSILHDVTDQIVSNYEDVLEEDLGAKNEELIKAYDALVSELKSKQENFMKNKEAMVSELLTLKAIGLAEEIKNNVSIPKNEEETNALLSNLSEVNDCISLEKSLIVRGLHDMEQMKENFENQCLQRCIHIKTELERLSKLSKIILDGESINMINLVIPYVKDEFYKEKMSYYIDEIVHLADECKTAEERLKFIKTSLSLKKLFSVIVTDMNSIKLTLYKRERIKEQSKHLRYEEAVGSTGQSQGIYIQFLIAIINYISNINCATMDSKGLLKVIFIDNPFGAAKDVYIWEPIFELLKTNQVQLIVPARGTTPAITGRFDVNYVLGQKIIDGRQQTVVVDYQSTIDANEVEYIPIQYEQTSMDWFETSENNTLV